MLSKLTADIVSPLSYKNRCTKPLYLTLAYLNISYYISKFTMLQYQQVQQNTSPMNASLKLKNWSVVLARYIC